MERLNIHYFGHPIHRIRSGGDRYISDVLDYLRKHGNLMIWDMSKEKLFQTQVRFRFTPKALLYALRWNMWAIKKLRKVKRGSVILVNSYFKQQFFIFLWFARYIKRLRPVIMVNALYFRSRKTILLNFIDKVLMLLFLIPARQIVCNSNGTRNALMNLGLNSDKITVVFPSVVLPPDIPTDDLLSTEGFQIAFVGNVTPPKKFHLLIDALSNLTDIPWSLKVAGETDRDSEYFNKIQKSLRELSIESRVHFLGRIEGEALTRLYKSSHVLVSPGTGEGFGRVVIEAMYFGCTVIGASCEATSELISDGKNGLLFKADNAESLAKKLRYLYDHPKKRAYLSQRAMESARNPKFYENIGEKILVILQNMVNENCTNLP